MALSRHIVKTISGISRPAIASSLPNVNGAGTTVLDLVPIFPATLTNCYDCDYGYSIFGSGGKYNKSIRRVA